MAKDIIRYDLLVQDAMRGVMRKVLAEVAERGYLPGEHHFTISFRTDAEGVTISRRLKEQWPRELTIILQHQYSNLEVDDDGFGVTLSFRSIPENLYVPFDAVTGFFDPSVEFGLRFGAEADEDETEAPPARPALVAVDGDTNLPANGAKAGKPETAKSENDKADAAKSEPAKKDAAKAEPARVDRGHAELKPEGGKSGADKAKAGEAKADAAKADPAKADAAKADEANDTKIVSIDAFRKKT